MTSSPNDTHIREVVEFQIKVPYGHIAAKWWGRRDVRPILCIHGWQDNAGTFDTLIPLLPDHVGYLAIDMPGHGLSSRIPDGLVYGTADDLYILNFIIRQFGWSRVSLMGHSMGAILSFELAAAFPERVDLVIALDALQPRVLSQQMTDYLMEGLENCRTSDMRNIAGIEPPNYTFDEMVEKMNAQTFLSVSRSSAVYLLARAVKESSSQKERYFFTRDNRLKNHQPSMYTQEILESLAKSIECPFLFIKALQSPNYDSKIYMDAVLDIMMEKPNFSMTAVNGGHHVHLNDPESVSDAIVEFLLKNTRHTEEPVVLPSKL